jgi:hypothetical protein
MCFAKMPGQETGRIVLVMNNVIPFKLKSAKEKHKGNTLCKNGHHKWAIVTESRFDVKQGKLVTVSRCQRCDAEKQELK